MATECRPKSILEIGSSEGLLAKLLLSELKCLEKYYFI